MGQSKINNPEKRATSGTQDEKTKKQRLNTKCVGHRYTQSNTNSENKRATSYKQLEVKKRPNIARQIIGQQRKLKR